MRRRSSSPKSVRRNSNATSAYSSTRLTTTSDEIDNYQQGIRPSGPHAKDLLAFFDAPSTASSPTSNARGPEDHPQSSEAAPHAGQARQDTAPRPPAARRAPTRRRTDGGAAQRADPARRRKPRSGRRWTGCCAVRSCPAASATSRPWASASGVTRVIRGGGAVVRSLPRSRRRWPRRRRDGPVILAGG